MTSVIINVRAPHHQTDAATGVVAAIAAHMMLGAFVKGNEDRDLDPRPDIVRGTDHPLVHQATHLYQRTSSNRVIYASLKHLLTMAIRASAIMSAETLAVTMTLEHE